ncbi:MAG: malectin domain-containing carbohydrate-binding protein [Terriglobia bacterium]
MSDSLQIQDQERASLKAVLESRAFSKCQNLAKLLQYLCQKRLAGCASNLKEYNIGVEVLGRTPDFNPAENSIVRVEIHRLREKLKKYYREEGAADSCMITLLPGNYAPQFISRGAPAPDRVNGKPVSSEAAAHPGEAAPSPAASAAATPSMPAGGMSESGTSFRSHHAPRAGSTRLYLLIAAASAVMITLVTLHVQSLSRSRTLPPPLSAANSRPSASAVSPDAAVRILAGYTKAQYVDRAGREWRGDRYYAGGEEASLTQRFFLRTLDPTLFETYRAGDFAYNIPLAPGTYELRLYFSEGTYGPDTLSGGGETSRLFSVTLNGKPILSNFDILSDANGEDVADVRAFKDVHPASDGYLHLKFDRDISDPLVNAIEVAPAAPSRMNSIRIAAEDDSFTDGEGRLWNPDCYFEGGRLAVRKVPVEGTRDPGLYAGERFGHFDYAIPVAPGKYRLTLSFAETYFGAGNPGGGGAGSRTFDVYCNGAALLRNFDILKAAGGANRALRKVFDGLQPNAQGKLVLRFVPVENYACVNAIEVDDESK